LNSLFEGVLQQIIQRLPDGRDVVLFNEIKVSRIVLNPDTWSNLLIALKFDEQRKTVFIV